MQEEIKLSIIIPYYNAAPYTKELLECLDKQMQEGVEVTVVDDGSKIPFMQDFASFYYDSTHDWLQVIRQANGGVSKARNTGLDNAIGKYIAFIDADDLVASNYIASIMEKIEKGFDHCYLSWKTFGEGPAQFDIKLTNENPLPPSWNVSACTRVYNRNVIGNARFPEGVAFAEDGKFNEQVQDSDNKTFISETMYFYRVDTPGSLYKTYREKEAKGLH